MDKTLPTNVSFPLYKDWISKNVTIRYEGVSIKNQSISNGDFLSNADGWTYKSNVPTKYVNNGWQSAEGNPPGDVKMKLTSGVTSFEGDFGYYEQNITLNDELASGRTTVLSTNYYYTGYLPTGVNVYLAVIIGDIEKNITYDDSYIAQDSWQSLNMIYDPKAYGQISPGIMTVRVGLYTDTTFLITGQPAYISFDNIKLDLWTMPNAKNLVYAYDVEFPANYTYTNTSYGSGYSFIQIDRSRNLTQDVVFTIYNNVTGALDSAINNITIESDVVKLYNSTIFHLEGCSYSMGLNITWNSEFIVSIPFGYFNSWGLIKKPADWIIQEVTDLYDINHVANCTGAGFGSESLIIPSNIFGFGLWKLKAISQNCICKTNFLIWNNSQFIEDTKLTFSDIYKVNVTLNNSLSLSNTKINFTIYYPDNSILYHESKEPTAHDVNFGTFTVGYNMSVGIYKIIIIWTNNENYLMRDKVGYDELNFMVWHHTNLSAVDSHLEKISGEPALIKVKFTDLDFNSSIEIATITYNSTFGQSGTMVYLGGGIYFIDMDTSSLELGDYYFSFNATKTFYQNQTKINLIHLKILSEPLKLEGPNTVINAMGNNYAIFQVNLTGAISDIPIWPANLSTDWQNYTVIDHYNGTFTLNFSTWELPAQGIIETYTVTVFASKIFYGNTTCFITLTVHPIQTSIGVNQSIFVVNLGESVDVKVNYTEEGSEFLILGANCSVDWPSVYNIMSDSQGFVVHLDTVNLSIETYTPIIKLEKPGFETAYKSIIITISRIKIKVNTIDFDDSIGAFVGDTIMIKINLTENGTELYIENASIFYTWEFGKGYFDYIGNGTYELELKLSGTIPGSHIMTLLISKEGSIYEPKEFSFIISIKARERPNYVIWFVISAGLIGMSILGILTLRSYVILPSKRKKESALFAKTQRYKDIMNIEAIILSNRFSGINFYSKDYNFLQEYEDDLLSSFSQAIIMMGTQIVDKEESNRISIKSKSPEGIEQIIELDFKHFNFMISDYKAIRLIFILKEKASERFKDQTVKLLMEIDSSFSDKYENWNGELKRFNKLMPPLLDQYFESYYRDPFKLNRNKNINDLKKEKQLSKMELRLLNVIISITKTSEQEEFYLENAIRNVYEKNQDIIIDALENLIEKRILIPSRERKI
ncbi:MAG: hypothetical protein ACFFAQ_14275 [Promethearchaeota archaeon]